jgi:hypothetical protein
MEAAAERRRGGDAQLEKLEIEIEAPPKGERLLGVMRRNSVRELRCAFACDFSEDVRGSGSKAPPRRTSYRERARSRPAIQGRRVGEWLGNRRLGACAERRRVRSTSCVCVDLPHPGAGRRGTEATLRDRLTGRTPRSDRGDRGSTPCPGSRHGRVAQLEEHLSYKQGNAGSSPASPTARSRGRSSAR